MNINELKRIAEENDYELTKSNVDYKLTDKYCENNITINYLRKKRLWISTPFHCDERDFEMIKAAVEFAETPLEDREEEKKFYLRHKWLNLDTDNYLHLDVDDGSCMLDDDEEFSYTKIKLTKKEIKEIKERFNTDLADFELVEVVDEN